MTLWAGNSEVDERLKDALKRSGVNVTVIAKENSKPVAQDHKGNLFYGYHAIAERFNLSLIYILTGRISRE